MTAVFPVGGEDMGGRERHEVVCDFASVVLCDNPGLMELEGTNTWVLRAPGSSSCVVVDPGPTGHRQHFDRVTAVTAGLRVDLVLITHEHHDHVGGAAELAELLAAPVRAYQSRFCIGGPALLDGEVIKAAGLRLTVVHTPGHTMDSVCLLVEHGNERALLTGDTIMGAGTAVLDGGPQALQNYLGSLDRLAALGPARLLPGHGPHHDDALPVIRGYREHRLGRLAEVRKYLRVHQLLAGEADAVAVSQAIYPGLAAGLAQAALMSTRVQLRYLADLGE